MLHGPQFRTRRQTCPVVRRSSSSGDGGSSSSSSSSGDGGSSSSSSREYVLKGFDSGVRFAKVPPLPVEETQHETTTNPNERYSKSLRGPETPINSFREGLRGASAAARGRLREWCLHSKCLEETSPNRCPDHQSSAVTRMPRVLAPSLGTWTAADSHPNCALAAGTGSLRASPSALLG